MISEQHDFSHEHIKFEAFVIRASCVKLNRMNELAANTEEKIASRILVVRGERVLLDADLAALYGVATKRFNEQVRRNRERFPPDFGFRLSNQS